MAEGFWESLKSGILLCKAINAIRPNTIDPKKIGTRVNAMVERANIQLYLDSCTKLGMDKSDLFLPSDLNERKYLSAVLQNILALATMVENRPGYYGPSLFGAAAVAGGGNAPLHRRSRSFGGALKPWDFDQQMKETANRVAEEKKVDEAAAAPVLAPATRQAIAGAPVAAARTETVAATSAPPVPAGPKRKTEERYILKLLKALVPITRSDNYDLEADMRVLKQQRIKSLDHLLILLGHKDYWAKLDLSLVTKVCVEEALTNAFVRQVATAKEKVKQVRAIIERGEVLVPNSDDLIADLEAQEAEASGGAVAAPRFDEEAEAEEARRKEKREKKEKAKKEKREQEAPAEERVVVEPPKKPITKMHIPLELVTSPPPKPAPAPAPAPVPAPVAAPVATAAAPAAVQATPERRKKGGSHVDATPSKGSKAAAAAAAAAKSAEAAAPKKRNALVLVPVVLLLVLLLAAGAACALLIWAPHTPLAQSVHAALEPVVGRDVLRSVKALGG